MSWLQLTRDGANVIRNEIQVPIWTRQAKKKGGGLGENSAENGERLGAKEKLSSSGQKGEKKEFNSFQLGIVCSLFFSHPLCFSRSFMAHT